VAQATQVDPFVRFNNVAKTFDGETLVIKSLNLDVYRGELLTLLGPSGSGKTTILMMLAGFETPTQGQIYIGGKAVNHIPPYKRNIGFVFQDYALFPHMTVRENLAFPLEVKNASKSEVDKKVSKALEMVELVGFEARRPRQLSGGQQQRVALARALVFEPQLVLMDEPLGALDKNLREQMQYEIKHIHENLDVTLVYVTHDQSEAMTLSNRIAVLKSGQLQQLSTPDVIYEKPINSFVAQFVGENNTFSGKITAVTGDKCTVKINGAWSVKALKVHVDGKGEQATLSLRPERVNINPPEGTVDNVFEGSVLELIYRGDHIRARLSVCGNDDFIVKMPNAQGPSILANGQVIRVGWSSNDCRALDRFD
jgi:putative spermidine/putrescine transport system ATP-binding protein